MFSYLAFAFAGLAGASLIRLLLDPRALRPKWASTIAGALMTGIGASLFLPLKYAIPRLVPFWLDAPLSRAERAVFTADPWLLFDRILGWGTMPIDRLYGLWLPTQTLILFLVMLQPPSTVKSRLLIAYFLAWFVLGVVAALIFSSAGPIFYDRLFGGNAFAPLRETLHGRGAWVVLTESDRMWASLASSRPGIVAGISAMPSMHVAICVWMILAARALAARAAPFAVVYAALIWIGSVQLGWHYITDGLAGMLGMVALWPLSGALERWSKHSLLDRGT
ncbi:MAG: phosphatase PAP2 family protein [Sphingomicrobium sp.]